MFLGLAAVEQTCIRLGRSPGEVVRRCQADTAIETISSPHQAGAVGNPFECVRRPGWVSLSGTGLFCPMRGGGVGDVAEVWVQVVPVDGGREISWGSNRVQSLADRLEDVKAAIAAGARAVADSLPGLPMTSGWELDEVTGSFGLSLTAEAGVILTKASVETTFEVTVTYKRSTPPAASVPGSSG